MTSVVDSTNGLVDVNVGLTAAVASTGVTFVVDSTNDLVDVNIGDGVCASARATCTLRAAIQETNALPGTDVIDVPAGTYELAIPPLNQNLANTGDLDITDSVAINGAGPGSTVVDGGVPPAGSPVDVRGLDRLFEVLVDGGTVTFSGLTISDGYAAEYGGAIMNNSTATVTVADATLLGNVARKTGGAIDNHLGGVVDVHDSRLSGNFAGESGSALNNNRGGIATVTESVVSANSAASVGLDEALFGAGAIANNAELDARGTIVVTDSQIDGNRTGGGRSGAGISNDGGGVLRVERTTFSKNHAAGSGGAIFNGTGEVTVTDSRFSENAAKGGGGIASTGGLVDVLASTFSKNSAEDWGGGIRNSNQGGVTVRSSSFSENSALNGGGFANEGTGLVTVEDSTFTKNSARETSVLGTGEGGGMHSNSGGQVVITGGAFTENRAGSGGGFSNEGGGTATITGSRVAANTADERGGGILVEGGAVRMVAIDVVGNVANGVEEGGGGISYAGDKAVSIGESAAIENSRIRGNKSGGDGGGIDSRGDGPLAIATTAITGNTAVTGGAVHHVGDATLLVTRSTLSANTADHGGGVFSDGDGEATLENATVSGNRAGQFGGGLLVSSRLTLRSSTVANNSAPSGGGVNNGGGDLIGDGTVFLANTIVAGNPAGGNCAGTITSRGGNVENTNTCQLTQLSDQPGTDPRLGPLADNGGPTQTHALLAGSPAQEKAVCTAVDPCPPVDQRGLERPSFDRVDAGAYESELTPDGSGVQQCAGRTERPVPSDFDGWVSQGSPSSNFGSDSILKVRSQAGSNERALVHFALPPAPPGCRLVGATLRLYSSASTADRTVEAVRLASAWSESGVTWSNQPATAGSAAAAAAASGVVEWDVLAQTLDMYALGQHGFLIRDRVEGGSGAQSFHSREKGADRPPELVLVFDDPDAPPPPGECPTTPQLFSADRDSWISESSPSNNFGNDSSLKVKSQRGSNARALVRFPLPGLPSGCTTVASAVLRLEASAAKTGHSLEAQQVASSWSETGVTWSNQPAVTGRGVSIPSVQGTLEWDVTSQTLAIYGSANNGYLIRDAAENGVGDEQVLGSREKLGSGPELVLTFDDSTPETSVDSGPSSPTEETVATFTFSSDRQDSAFECSLDGAAFTACTSPHAVRGLVEGSHRFEVRSTRPVRAVDPTPARYEWKVAVPPETNVSGPGSPSGSASATLSFSSDDAAATFECSLDGATFTACTSPIEYAGLADGDRTFRVRATDPLGNVDATPASHVWTVAVPPETTIESAPSDPTNETSAKFEFAGRDNSTAPDALLFECKLDLGDWEPCASPQHYPGLADGRHEFQVRATDAAGNADDGPASYTWTVDTVAPETTLDSAPPDPSNDSSPSFSFGSEDGARFECKLDLGDWEPCASPQHYPGLADGRHEFQVRAADPAGNSDDSPASYAWTIDTVPPGTSLGSTPADPSNDASPTFAFSSEDGARFECKVDLGDWVGCSSPHAAADLADGRHEFQVRATDAAGNADDSPASYAWTVDTVAPETRMDSAPPDPSSDSSPSVAFSSEPGATFQCKLDLGDWAACSSPKEYAGLLDGSHNFQVRASDLAGNGDDSPASYSWTIDTVAPETEIDGAPADPSNDASPGFSFTSEVGASFQCKLDVGDWEACASPKEYAALADGEHAFAVRASDVAGNTDDSPASHSWTIDTVAPETTLHAAPADPSNDASPSFAFSSEADATFECKLDLGDWEPCSSPSEYAALADGEHAFAVRASDVAGNTDDSPASHSWTIDTVAPETTIASAPPDPSNDPSPSFAFSSEHGATFQCKLDLGDWAACSSPKEYAGLLDGDHSFAVRASDAAANSDDSPASYTWTVDTVAPETTLDSPPPDPSKDPSPTFAFSSEPGATFQCKLDLGEWATCSSPHEYADLADGSHTFAVRANDAAGNADDTPASYAWTVDTLAPETTIDAAPADPSNDSSPSFAFTSEPGGSFQCKLDLAEWEACSSPRDYADVGDGSHGFAVRATDAAGNTDASPASYSWTIDTAAPETSLDASPADPSNDAAPSFAFSSEPAATFECQLDLGEWAPCTTPKEYADLADGEHTFAVRASDPAGNTDSSPVSYTWTIDTVAPDTTLDSTPSDPSNDASPSFAFSSEPGASFQCKLDLGDWATCSSPKEYAALADGEHSFAVRASDAAGNSDDSPVSYTWTVDTVAPETTLESAPPDPSNDSSPSFAFSSEPGATFQCKLALGDWAACSTPTEYVGLADGDHTLAVRASDAAGNSDDSPASYTWTVDTVAPETMIDSGPDAKTQSTSATLTFSAHEPGSSFHCSLDGAEVTACTSPREYTGLATGAHEFRVHATDAAGNVDTTPALHEWAVEADDATAPETTIESAPGALTNATTARFTFSSETGASFRCSLDGAAFADCTSPREYTGMIAGGHTFRVEASDAAGNADPTPASHSWTIDTSAPETTIDSGPPARTNSTSARFTFSSETGASFRCSLDGGAFAACASPREYTDLIAGTHTFRVEATDGAGNSDSTPASYSWTIDTTPPETTIESAPGALTNATTARFTFSSETGASFRCSLDGAAFADCTSPREYTGMIAGGHTFRVEATDAAGNADPTPASRSWTIDTSAPDTRIDLAPPATTDSTSAGFGFSATESGSSFHCSLDGSAFAACTSPRDYTGLAPGTHTFHVRATDPAGTTDPTPASYSWTISPSGSCSATTVTAGSAADSWVLESSATSNYGNDSVVKVDSKAGANARVLVRFALPLIPSGCRVTDARLRLYASSYKTGRTVQALRLAASWTEGGVTWNSQPGTTGTAATVAAGDGYREWSVASHVQAMYLDGNHGFLIRDATEDGGGIEQGFHSREKATDNPPRLVLTFG